jgi:hypothetical protein
LLSPNVKQYGSEVNCRVSPPEGVFAKDIHTEVEQVIRSDAIAYSTVTKHIRNDAVLENEREAKNRAENQGFSITDNVILETLEMMPFASIRQIVKMTIIPPTTVFPRSTKSLDFVLKRLCWFPSDSRIFKNRFGPSSQRSY